MPFIVWGIFMLLFVLASAAYLAFAVIVNRETARKLEKLLKEQRRSGDGQLHKLLEDWMKQDEARRKGEGK